MMIVYTAEDFEQAMFAVHPDPDAVGARYAARMNREPEYPWLLDGVPGNGDEHMARDGWVPVVEATEVMQNRQINAEAHLDQIERLSRQLVVAEKQIESRELALEGLLEEKYRLDRIVQAPLTLDALEAAWEAAEEADECRKGDVLIMRDPVEGYSVWRTGDADYLSRSTRILSRAPQREAWEDLADDLADRSALMDEDAIETAAKALHAAGWRKGGEES